MINLIPPSAQIQVKREYWIRVFSVWLFLVGTACIVVLILHAPTYVLVRGQLKTYLEAYNQATDVSQTFKESEAAITEANEIAKLLANSETVTPFSSIIVELEKIKGTGIMINTFTFSRKADMVDSITIAGEARSRLVLADFRDAIEQSERFESATLPLSNLAKDKQIPFVITIIPSEAFQ